MKYYLILKEKPDLEPYEVGESSFKSFYPEEGFRMIKLMVNRSPETLELVEIKNDQDKTLSIEEFLDDIKGLIIRE